MDELVLMHPRRILPGHGPVMDNWEDALAKQRRYLEVLSKDVRALITNGAPISAAAGSTAKAEKDRWSLFEEYNPRNATAAFAELEWE
jgi:glyoxylase-like metal-dependent hydrolase (beta-lactamase superfamily II)